MDFVQDQGDTCAVGVEGALVVVATHSSQALVVLSEEKEQAARWEEMVPGT